MTRSHDDRPQASTRARLGRGLRRLLVPKHEMIGRLEALEQRTEANAKALRQIVLQLDKIGDRISQLQDKQRRALEAIGAKGLEGRLHYVQRQVQALLRSTYLDATALPHPFGLTAQRFGILSQQEEDGLTLALFGLIGVTDRRFAELGAGKNGGNSGFLARECGWHGLMVEVHPERADRLRRAFRFGNVAVAACWIARETVNELLAEHGLTGSIDLVSVDIDGNDYWVWDALTVASPRVIIVEYNDSFGGDRAVTIPYDPAFDRHAQPDRRYYGASLRAFERLAARKGYRLVLLEPRGVNAYFLRADVRPDLPALAPARLPPESLRGEDIFAACARLGLPLVEVDA